MTTTSKEDSKQFVKTKKNHDIDQTNYKNKNYYGCISQLNNWGIDNGSFGYFAKYFRSRLFIGDFLLPYAEKRQFFEIMPRTGGIFLEYLLSALESCFSQNVADKVEKEFKQKYRESLIIPKYFQFLFMSQVFSPFQDYKKFFYNFKKFARQSTRFIRYLSSRPAISIFDVVHLLNGEKKNIFFTPVKLVKVPNSFRDTFKYIKKNEELLIENKKNDVKIRSHFLTNKLLSYPKNRGIVKKQPCFTDYFRIFPNISFSQFFRKSTGEIGPEKDSEIKGRTLKQLKKVSHEKEKCEELRILKKKQARLGNARFREYEQFDTKEKQILRFQKKIFETTERISSIKFEKPFYWYQLNHFFSYTDFRISKFIYSLIISCKRKTFATSWKTIGNPMQSFLFSVHDFKNSSSQKKTIDLSTFQAQNTRNTLNNENLKWLNTHNVFILSNFKTDIYELSQNPKKMCEFFKIQTDWKNDRFQKAIFLKDDIENYIKKTTILTIYYQISSFNYHLTSHFPTKTVLLICLVLIKLFKILVVKKKNYYVSIESKTKQSISELPLTETKFFSFVFPLKKQKTCFALGTENMFHSCKTKNNWDELGIYTENTKKFYFSSGVYDLNSTKIKSAPLAFFDSSNNIPIFPSSSILSSNLEQISQTEEKQIVDYESNFIEKTKIYNIFISDFFSIDWKNNTNENMAFLPSLNFPSWAPDQNIFSSWSENEIFMSQENYDAMRDLTSNVIKSKFSNWPNLEEAYLQKEKFLVSNAFEKKSKPNAHGVYSVFSRKKKKIMAYNFYIQFN